MFSSTPMFVRIARPMHISDFLYDDQKGVSVEVRLITQVCAVISGTQTCIIFYEIFLVI